MCFSQLCWLGERIVFPHTDSTHTMSLPIITQRIDCIYTLLSKWHLADISTWLTKTDNTHRGHAPFTKTDEYGWHAFFLETNTEAMHLSLFLTGTEATPFSLSAMFKTGQFYWACRFGWVFVSLAGSSVCLNAKTL